MSTFEITGGVDPLLAVRMQKGGVLFAESNAMVAMDKSLTLTGEARGGVLSSLGRKLLNDENFFQERFEAKEGPGTVLLAPIIPGEVNLLEVGTRTYLISDGAYLASTEGVTLEIKSQGLGKALFARSGGFFLMKATGSGTLAVSGFGSIRALTVTPDKPLVVDNGHVVAWDASLNYDLTINTAHRGFFGKLIEGAVTGEGIVLTFTGTGTVLVCSRNRGGFIDWIAGNLPQEKAAKNR